MEKMTAVQWLINELKTGDFDNAPISVMLGIIEKALEMEKEQMRLAYHEDRPLLLGYETGEFFEEHYKENYEQGK